MAIGIAHPRDPERVVYVSTHQKPPSTYFIDLGDAGIAKPGLRSPVENADYETLLSMVRMLVRSAS
jgi:hypothetical protein